MKKRICSVLLVLALTLVVLLPTAQAVDGGIEEQGIRQISKTKYNVTSDVTEYEWLLNNGSLTEQMVGHVMEVKVGSSSTASIAVGYGDDNIESIASGKNWAMTETTKQAQSMQTSRNINVVGAINAGGYDMSNGRPSGAFIMSGTQINAPTGTTFWIDKDGNKRRSAEVVADNVYFGESKRSAESSSSYGGNAYGGNNYGGSSYSAPAPAPSYGGYSAPASAPASDFAMLEDDDAQLPF